MATEYISVLWFLVNGVPNGVPAYWEAYPTLTACQRHLQEDIAEFTEYYYPVTNANCVVYVPGKTVPQGH